VPFRDDEFPAFPYPGRRPPCSFVHDAATGWPLRPDRGALSGWRVEDGHDLDGWLAERGAAPLAERVPVLCYGSNACPAKVTWLRETLGLPGPAVLLRAHCSGIAAVWAAGLRVVDDQRPATLADAPGVTERHAVWLATPEQVEVLDVCEGRGARYQLSVLAKDIRLDDGTVLDRLLGYTAAAPIRRPLLVDGKPVRCADVEQAEARALTGEPAPTDGLGALRLDGAPLPADFPGRVFVYGTLQPAASHWHLLADHAAGTPRPAELPGRLYDTGRGYPALLPGGPGRVSGWLVDLSTPDTALSVLDDYEGTEYRRVRTATADGTPCWTYVWIEQVAGMRALSTPWPT
jgi:gamma-glutamylcyclotransferase (GGCT)/AIG2-like uncharacterized protein YtfP